MTMLNAGTTAKLPLSNDMKNVIKVNRFDAEVTLRISVVQSVTSK